MKWAQVIMVRTADGSAKMLAATLQNLMNDVARNAENESIRVFRREKLNTEICIVLFHSRKSMYSSS